METYYIYAHYTLNTNECFYIGLGKKKRAWDSYNRNSLWHNIVNKHGYKIEIVKSGFLNRKEAVNKEVMLQLFFKPRACLQYGDRCKAIVSEETRLKMSQAKVGKKMTNKNKLALLSANKGSKLTKETKLKISMIHKGVPKSNKHKAKLSEAISRPIINCKSQIFSSAKEAAKVFNLKNAGCITNNLKGRAKSAGKYKDGTKVKWSYYESI